MFEAVPLGGTADCDCWSITLSYSPATAEAPACECLEADRPRLCTRAPEAVDAGLSGGGANPAHPVRSVRCQVGRLRPLGHRPLNARPPLDGLRPPQELAIRSLQQTPSTQSPLI